MFRNNKVSGNTLVVTIIVALIIALLCSSLVLLAYYNRHTQITANIEHRLRTNLQSATAIVLADTGWHGNTGSDTIDLYDEQKDSVIIRERPWGLFEAVSVTAFSNRFSQQSRYFTGAPLTGYMEGCLYLADHRRSLYVSGSTTLTGNAYLSKAGISPSYIYPRVYNNDRLIYGNIKNSKEKLPALNTDIISYLYEQRVNVQQSDEQRELIFSPGDTLRQSFSGTGLFFYSKDPVMLNNLAITGQVKIQSDTLIEVSATVSLEDVILIAPIIRFANGFTGSVQAIATDSLVLGANCRLTYPSALVLLKKPGITTQNVVKVGAHAVMDGIILTVCDSTDVYKTYVELHKESLIRGVVYVSGFISMQGKVHGTVLTDYFIHRSGSAVYENHLVDVELNRKKMSEHFVTSPVFTGFAGKEIIKWLQ
jgi:hypothetical protein